MVKDLRVKIMGSLGFNKIYLFIKIILLTKRRSRI